MNILITGGAGFVGSRLSNRLATDGHSVVVLDNLLQQVHPILGAPTTLLPSVKWMPIDVSIPNQVDNLIADFCPEIVALLAAETGTGQSLDNSSRHIVSNVLGVGRVLDAMTNVGHRPSRIVLTSSRSVYGEGDWSSDSRLLHPRGRVLENLRNELWNPVSDDGKEYIPLPNVFGETLENPVSVYGSTKLAQEHILRCWTESREVGLSILRLQNVYGPGQSPSNPYTGVATHFVNVALSKNAIPVFEDGMIYRDFVYIDNVVDELYEEITVAKGLKFIGRDIGSGEKVSILELAKLISSICNAPQPLVTKQFRLGDVRSAYTTKDTNQQRIPLAKGLESLVEWRLSN